MAEASFDQARAAADLAFQNLARLGASCEQTHRRYKELVHERDLAIRGVSRWGFSHRQLASAARVTPQRVSQVLGNQPRVRITELGSLAGGDTRTTGGGDQAPSRGE